MKKTQQHVPPQLFYRFFRWFCHPKLLRYIEGDLMELYGERLKQSGKRKADIKFIIDVLLLFRPGIIRPAEGYQNLNTFGMYKSYFKIGWRNLLKNKGYSFINIGGLAAGMAVAMFIGLWIYDELSFHKYHKNYNNIARVMRNVSVNGETRTTTILPNALGDELKNKYGDNFKRVVLAWEVGGNIISVGEKRLSLRGDYIEPVGPEMFSVKMLRGPLSGLKDPHSILLSESSAKALFGDENPMDKLLQIGNRLDVKVTGVYEDLPYNAHFYGVDFFAPWDLLVSANQWLQNVSFTNDFLAIYAEVEDHTDVAKVSDLIKDAILNNVRDNEGYVAVNPQVFLHPMNKWHLWSEFKNGVNIGGFIQTVWLFGIVGVFVLLLACINFMNMSTARSEKRAKEVGLRKAIGSVRTQLMHQFFSESFLVVVLAFVFALALVVASLNWFNELAGKQMEMPWSNPYFWLSSCVFILITGLLAGSYPALYLSSFNPVTVMKGSLRAGRFSTIPRKVLVVVQFTVSVTLIIGTAIVYQQIQFAQNRPVGYDRNGLLMVPMTSLDFFGTYETLRTELKNTGIVTEIAESSSPLTDIWTENGGFDWRGKDPAFVPQWATLTVTPEYGKTIGWQFVNGRDFARDLASDSAGFIINEAAAKLLGFENPVGETVQWQGGWRSKYNAFTVVGVVKDMVMTSPYAPSQPAVFFLSRYGTNWINIRIDAQTSASDALPKIEAVFKKVIPSAPFTYKFADQEYALKFVAEERIGKLASVFTVLAILISCLGLFGLASFVAEQRTKEIGIRKVLGASVSQVWQLLSRDFVLPVIISCLVAIPLSFYFMNDWLMQFEYRVAITWQVFVMSGVGALVITLLTVSFQSVKAALANPVKSLRSE